jgi:hypothetical protein
MDDDQLQDLNADAQVFGDDRIAENEIQVHTHGDYEAEQIHEGLQHP